MPLLENSTWYLQNKDIINELVEEIVSKTYQMNIPTSMEISFYQNEDALRLSILEYIYKSSRVK
jgi:hypothetical protein